MKALVAMDLSDVPIVGDDTTVFTVLNDVNKKWASENQGIGVQFIKLPGYIKAGDKVINTFVKKALKIENEYQDMLHFVYFSHMTSFYLSSRDFDQVLFENQILCEKVLIQFGNFDKYEDRSEIL